jgi:hypothetical protein
MGDGQRDGDNDTNSEALDQRKTSNSGAPPVDEPTMPTLIQCLLDNSREQGKSNAKTGGALSEMVKDFCATYNATYVKDVVAKQVGDLMAQAKGHGEQEKAIDGSSKGKETPGEKEE